MAADAVAHLEECASRLTHFTRAFDLEIGKILAFTKALGGQSMDFGVRVVAVNPGPVETDRMIKINKRRALDLYGDEARHVELRAKYPGGRPASPGEVADLIAFLASPRAGYISGSIVTIDGGIASRGSIIKEKS